MNEIYSVPGFAEPVSCWTHLLGAVVFLVLSVPLVIKGRENLLYAIALAVFGFSVVFLLSMSGVYHLLSDGGTARFVLRCLDHAAIYTLIAGTFTAVHTLLFQGISRWGMIVLVWIVAAVGITLKSVFFESMPETLSLSLYLAFGWLGIVTGIAVWRRYGFSFIKPLLYGGIAYTLGALLEFIRKPVLIEGVVGPHELFHIAVIIGISFHWAFVHRSLGVAPETTEL